MRIVWTEPASRDLEDIGDYIAKDNPAAARRVVRAIEAAVRRLARFPHSGRSGHRAGTRELVVPRTPYIVPYRVGPRAVEILAVFHGARDWPNTFNPDS
jgi:toxin ParE1/3/4